MITPAGHIILTGLQRLGPQSEFELYTEIGRPGWSLAPFSIRAELRALARERPPLVQVTIVGRWALTDAGWRLLESENQLELFR